MVLETGREEMSKCVMYSLLVFTGIYDQQDKWRFWKCSTLIPTNNHNQKNLPKLYHV